MRYQKQRNFYLAKGKTKSKSNIFKVRLTKPSTGGKEAWKGAESVEKKGGYAFDSPTDIRFLILFTLTAAKRPLTNAQIVEVVLSNTAVNFFDLQEQVDALASMGEITFYRSDKGDTVYVPSEVGNMTIEFFFTKVPPSVREKIEESLWHMMKQEKIEEQITARIVPAGMDKYMAECTISADDQTMFHLSLYAGDKKAAMEIESCMKQNAEIFYKEMMASLAEKMKEK